jgi:hypothetical protein
MIFGKGKNEHKNPLNGSMCKGFFENYHLGHRFMTDVLEIKIDVNLNQDEYIYSLLYAILDGASEALGINRRDIDGTIYPQGYGLIPAMIFFDNVPGGAGHVFRIYENLLKTFEIARKRVASCECGEETSCYNCLRNYSNQFFHDKLQRGVALRILNKILG